MIAIAAAREIDGKCLSMTAPDEQSITGLVAAIRHSRVDSVAEATSPSERPSAAEPLSAIGEAAETEGDGGGT